MKKGKGLSIALIATMIMSMIFGVFTAPTVFAAEYPETIYCNEHTDYYHALVLYTGDTVGGGSCYGPDYDGEFSYFYNAVFSGEFEDTPEIGACYYITDEGKFCRCTSWFAPCSHENNTYHEAVSGDCQNKGTIAYWQCNDENCGKLFSDEACTNEITDTTGSLGDHRWETNFDEYGHWIECSVCQTKGNKENHKFSDDSETLNDGNKAYYTCSECGCENLYNYQDFELTNVYAPVQQEVTTAIRNYNFPIERSDFYHIKINNLYRRLIDELLFLDSKEAIDQKVEAAVTELKTIKAEAFAEYKTVAKERLAADAEAAKESLNMKEISDSVKTGYFNEIDSHVETGNGLIDTATDKAGVDAALEAANIKNDEILNRAAFMVNQEQKSSELDAYANTAKENIEALVISDAEKTALKGKVDEAVASGKAAIAQATDETGADGALQDAKDSIDEVKEEGTVLEFATYQTQQNSDFDTYANTAKDNIEALVISDAEKTTLKGKVDDAVTSGKAAIAQATDKKGVDEALAATKGKIDLVKEEGNLLEHKTAKKADLASHGDVKTTDVQKLFIPEENLAEFCSQIGTHVDNGKDQINAATDKATVDAAHADAVKNVNEVADSAQFLEYQLKNQNLLSESEQLVRENITALGLANEDNFLAEASQIVESGINEIKAAQDKDEVDEAYKAAIDALNKLSEEAQKAFEDYQNETIAQLENDQAEAEEAILKADIPEEAKNTLLAVVRDHAEAAKAVIENAENTAVVDAAYKQAKSGMESAQNFQTYEFFEGKDSDWELRQDGSVTMRMDAPFENFLKVLVDGKILDPSNYTVVAGSTKVTFNKNYLDSLSVGEHSVTFVWTDGVANATLTIEAKAEAPQSETPKTGDVTDMTLWIVLIGVAVLIGAGATVYTLRRKDEE